MKVLSLFFVDRVAHYAEADGKFRKWFVELYEEISQNPRYVSLTSLPVDKVHNGYFAEDKGKAKDTSGSTKADDEVYALIMQKKEELLSLEVPLQFIFSHSALRVGGKLQTEIVRRQNQNVTFLLNFSWTVRDRGLSAVRIWNVSNPTTHFNKTHRIPFRYSFLVS